MKTRQAGGMAAAAAIVMSSIILSRVTGFIRENMLSWKVGLSWVQDAYIASFTVPDLMYTLLVGGTISAALIPVFSGYLEKGEEEYGWRVASTFINTIFIVMVLFCILGIILAPYIVDVVAMGTVQKIPEARNLATTLTRILFPSVAFLMLAGMCNGVLYSYRKFAAAAYGPTVYNICCALSIALFADTRPESMVMVAVGVACSSFIYFMIQVSFELKDLKYYRVIIDFRDRGFKHLMNQAIPSLLSSSAVQINVIISIMFVSLSLAEGSISAFRNANTLWQLPYGVFAMGIGTAVLPTLSRKYAANENTGFKNILVKSLTSVLFLTIPSAAGFIILRGPIVRAIFVWGGKFNEKDVPFVAGILAVFSVAMITQSVVATMNRSFYACRDTKTPLFIGAGSIILNLFFGYLFYRTTNLGASGMALSYSIISTINSILLVLFLNRKLKGIRLKELFGFISRAVPSSMAMGTVLWLLDMLPVHLGTKPVQLLYLLFEITVGFSVYFAAMLLLKAGEAVYFMNMVKGRLKGPQSIKIENNQPL